jgi:hypothetical protein
MSKLPTHSLVSFVMVNKSSSNAIVSIKKEVDDDTYDIIAEFFDDNLKRNSSKVSNQWLIKADEAHDICGEIDKLIEEADNREDESDDELIQEALARRFHSESSGKVIEQESVDDSEDEDVISLSRRLRHLYKRIQQLERSSLSS